MPATIGEYVIVIILGLAVLLIFIGFLFPGSSFSSAIGNSSIPMIVIPESPYFTISSAKLGSSYYSYDVDAEFNAKVYGKFSEPVEVMSIISFKGLDVPAVVLESRRQGDTFSIDDKTEKLELRLWAKGIESMIPPTRKNTNNYYSGRIEKYEKIPLMNGDSNFTITLLSIKKQSLVSQIFNMNLAKTCNAEVEIRCSSSTKVIAQFTDCKEGKCSRTIPVCENEVSITVRDMSCDEDFIDVYVEGKGAAKNPYEVGEQIGISFWKNSDCVEKYKNSYMDIMGRCGTDFLGKSIFTVPPAG